MKEISAYELGQYLGKFSSFDFVIAIEAALKGHSKGRLFADQMVDPNLLILWNEFDGFYVSLKSEDHLDLVKKGILHILKTYPQTSDAFVIYLDEKHERHVGKAVPVEKFQPLKVLLYTSKDIGVSESEVEASSSYAVLDRTNIDQLKDTGEAREVILSTWKSLDEFFEFGRGIVYIDNGSLKGYCISEHTTDRAVEFSIEVDEAYHRQGIGLNLGRIMVEFCNKNGKIPYWYCTDDNEASMKLAEKLGLQRQLEFNVWLFEYKEDQ